MKNFIPAAVGITVLATGIFVAPPFYLSLLTFAGTDALIVLALGLLMRAGQVSLGHAAFAGIGAYAAALLSREVGISPWLALPAGAAFAAAAAGPIGLVTLRLRGTYLPLATLAVGIACYVVFNGAEITGGSSGLDGIPPLMLFGEPLGPRTIAMLTWSVVIAVTLASVQLMRSRIGRAVRTFEHHEAVAVTFGVDIARVKITIFIVSAAVAGLAGALYAFHTRFISPTPFGAGSSFTFLIMVMLGGAAHPVGAVIGALTVGVINLLLQTFFSGLIDRIGPIEPVIFGVLLVVLLLRWPNGIWSFIAPFLGNDTTLRGAAPASSKPTKAKATITGQPGQPPLLELIEVDKRFGGIQALTKLSIKIPPGQIIGLVGPNGAGKSTAFNIMSGLSQPSAGAVCFRGGPMPKDTQDVVSCGIARTFQHVKLVGDMMVADNVALGAYWRGRTGVLAGLAGANRAEEADVMTSAMAALSKVGMADHAFTLADALPLGKQRLIEIARALAADSTLLLLDEPAAGLRAGEKAALVGLIKDLQHDGLTIVLVEHDMNLVKGCVDHLIVLDRGTLLAEGKANDVLRDAAVRAAYLGTGE